jgi:hypothetical protein
MLCFLPTLRVLRDHYLFLQLVVLESNELYVLVTGKSGVVFEVVPNEEHCLSITSLKQDRHAHHHEAKILRQKQMVILITSV